MLNHEELLRKINSAAESAAGSINRATLDYWHIHTSDSDRNQPNERNLTNHFFMHLFTLLDNPTNPPGMYFEARILGDILDGIFILSDSRICVLVESKHLTNQTKKWSFESDIEKMNRCRHELSLRLPGYSYLFVILADNWYDEFDQKWDNRDSITSWKKEEFEIRKSTKFNYNWRLLIASLYCPVACHESAPNALN